MSESIDVTNVTKSWYVVKTKSLAEKKVNERLKLNGFETYLPLITSWRIWSDRKKKVEKPLISSVVFARTDLQNLRNIYPLSGVAGILTHLGKPAVVQDFEINNLRILLQQEDRSSLETTERFELGETVEVVRGPFKGIIAIAFSEAGSFRLIVEMQSLGTGFTVNVPKSYVRKLNS